MKSVFLKKNTFLFSSSFRTRLSNSQNLFARELSEHDEEREELGMIRDEIQEVQKAKAKVEEENKASKILVSHEEVNCSEFTYYIFIFRIAFHQF